MTEHNTRRKDVLHPDFRLWLSNDEGRGSFGDGRWRLLEAIARCGSLRGAAAALGLSYRKAWNDLRKMEQAVGRKLAERARGGPAGGGMELTEAGKELVAAYGRFRTNVHEAVTGAFKNQMEGLLG